ncbi:MAG: methyltransferase type 12 [Burkholderiales bacterium]|nr:methyltransferase type 12 [Burkholderiales bacterium]
MQHPVQEKTQDSVRVDSARPQAAERARAAPAVRPWADRWAFLSGFLQHPGEVGSVIPSSGRLERRLVRTARLAQARTVVELGPGTGGTTRAFLRAMAPQARLLAIELSPAFAERLARLQPDPRLSVQHGSAERVAEYLHAHGLPAPDVVISGIPFSTMPPEVAEALKKSGEWRPEGGKAPPASSWNTMTPRKSGG